MWDIFDPQQFEFNRGELKWCCRCPKCGKKFCQRHKLMHHITTKHVSLRHSNSTSTGQNAKKGDQLFQCTFCQVKFIHKQSLEGHVATHHTSNGHDDANGSERATSGSTFLFMCRECDEKFDCDYSLWCHLMLHALSRPADHEQQMNNSSGKQYQCAKCTLKFTRKKDLKAHRESFHRYPNAGQQQQQRLPTEALFVSLFACDLCDEMFSGEGDLRRHRLSEHHHHHQHHQNAHLLSNQYLRQPNTQANYSDPYEKRDKPYKCSVCGSRFAEKIYLKWHGNLHKQSREGGRSLSSFFRRIFTTSALFDRLRCGTRFDLIANRRWHLTSKREKVLRAQSERYTLDLSVVESVGSRVQTMVHSVGSAIAKWLPKVLSDQNAGKRAAAAGHGIDKLYRTTCPNWYV